jgi:hypothetical protein
MKKLVAIVIFGFASSLACAEDITNAEAVAISPNVAGFSDFTDFTLFQSAFGAPLTRIAFDEVPVSTIVTNQYQNEGAIFTDGDDQTVNDANFVEDGVGLSANGRIHIQFSQPAVAVGAFFPGAMTIEVFDTQGGTSLHQSADFAGSGSGNFGGVVGDTGFGFVEIRDWFDDSVFIDDLVFGFGPPEGAISGCLKVTGIPLTLNVVVLIQPDEPRQLAQTDANGCYVFENPVPEKWFSIFILGTRVPAE